MRKAACCFIFLLIFAIQGVNVLADTYSWKDESGTIHFTDRPENIPPKYRKSHRVQKNNTVKNASPDKNTSPEYRHSRGNVSKTPSDINSGAQEKTPDFAATQKLAEQGDSYAQISLGIMYSKGQEVPKDDAKAVEWYRKAAEQGNAYGQVSLGTMYDMGRGVPRDTAKAVEWYRKAAEQGNAEAQSMLDMHDSMKR